MVKYCGNGKKIGDYGSINISFCLDDYPKDLVKTDKNGKRWLSLTLSPRKYVDDYGNTHSLKVNEYKPKEQSNGDY